jgi:hypothetical protein
VDGPSLVLPSLHASALVGLRSRSGPNSQVSLAIPYMELPSDRVGFRLFASRPSGDFRLEYASEYVN